MSQEVRQPVMLLLAGPNGAGKTTISEYVLESEIVERFINADTIAKGLSSGGDAAADIEAGRVMIEAVREAIDEKESFALETTLSGKNWLIHIDRARTLGYRVELWYVSVRTVDIAVERVRQRVRKGGHDIAEDVIRRRFQRSLDNLRRAYVGKVDRWYFFDNSDATSLLLGTGGPSDIIPEEWTTNVEE